VWLVLGGGFGGCRWAGAWRGGVGWFFVRGDWVGFFGGWGVWVGCEGGFLGAGGFGGVFVLHHSSFKSQAVDLSPPSSFIESPSLSVLRFLFLAFFPLR